MKFHDGETLDAEAAKFSIERHMTMQGSFRKPELAAVDHVEVVDPLTIKLVLKTPFSPLIAQLTDRAGMMVSPKAAKEAGDKFGLLPVCAGPYKFVERVQQDRIVVEKFADYWDKDRLHIDRITYLPIVDATVRLANLKSGGLDLIERLNATDIKAVKDDRSLKLSELPDLSIEASPSISRTAIRRRTRSARTPKCVRRSISRSTARRSIRSFSTASSCPAISGSARTNAYYQQSVPVPKRDVARAKALIKEAGVQTPIVVDFMVPQGAENKAVSEVVQAMAAEAGFDLKSA